MLPESARVAVHDVHNSIYTWHATARKNKMLAGWPNSTRSCPAQQQLAQSLMHDAYDRGHDSGKDLC
jgi:hypothetical protein